MENFVLLLNYRLVIVKKRKRVCQFIMFTSSCNRAPLVQQPPAPPKRRTHHNLTLHVLEGEENDANMDAPMSAFLKRAQKKKNDVLKIFFHKPCWIMKELFLK